MILFLVLIIKHPSKADTGNIPESKHTGKEMKQENNIKKTTYGAKAPQTKPRIVFKAVKAGKENHMTIKGARTIAEYKEIQKNRIQKWIDDRFISNSVTWEMSGASHIKITDKTGDSMTISLDEIE